MVHSLGDDAPETARSSFIAWNAEVIGKVVLEEETSVWFGATLRGDIEEIRVGRGSNVQDSASLHTDSGFPCSIGANVTIGHNAVVHGCTVGDDSLVGMGAVILNGAVIGRACIVGAGALVTEGKRFPDRSLIIGSPAKVARAVSDEEANGILENARRYRERAKRMRESGADRI